MSNKQLQIWISRGLLLADTAIYVSVCFVDGIDPIVKMLKSDSGDVREASAMALANLTAANTFNAR